MDVQGWLAELGLGRYAEAFLENDIDAETLPGLTVEDLKDLGVVSVGHRRKLLDAIARLEDDGPTAEVAPAPAADQAGERRQVTVLFADLSGFTALSADLDAEELHALMTRVFEVLDGVVADYGGTVDKHIGDAVMALFGAPIAHGDDPLRAARAALAMHEAIGLLGQEAGRPLAIHVGIAAGEVVAGGLGSAGRRDYTVVGDSVNLAARLNDHAEAGETLVSDQVYRSVADAMRFQDRGEVAVAGFQAPVQAWQAEGLRDRGVEERLPLVGREAEQAQFAGALDLCRRRGIGQLIVVRGEAGIGKTRLVEELARTAAAGEFACHRGLVLDFGVGKGQDAVRALVRSLLDAEGDEARRLDTVDRAVVEEMIEEEDRPFLYDLLDLTQPTALRAVYDAMDNALRNARKQAVFAGLVRAASRRRPQLLIVEDVHWADGLLLDYLSALARAAGESAALVVLTTRVDGDPLGAGWSGAHGGVATLTVDLGPLDTRDAADLAGRFQVASPDFAERCIARAEGNPLFLEQLLRNASESLGDELPGSIKSLVLSRVDRLEPRDKEALLAASVIGQRFSLDVLRHLVTDEAYACDALLSHHLVRRDAGGFLFAHALIQDGVYGSLLKARARDLHRRAANWFAERDLVLCARHLERAEDPEAPRAYLRAARAQAELYRFERAQEMADAGLALAVDRADRVALLSFVGELLHDVGKAEPSIEAYTQAREWAGDDTERCRAWLGLAAGRRMTDELDAALEALDRAQTLASGGMVETRARIHHLRGNLYFPLGRTDACLAEHQTALELARRAGSAEGEARALGGLADAEYARGRMMTAKGHFAACVDLCRRHGFGRIEVANASMLALTHFYANDLERAYRDGKDAAETAARVGHKRAEIIAWLVVYYPLYERGDLGQARSIVETALALTREINAMRFLPDHLNFFARMLLRDGEQEEAEEIMEEALRISREVGFHYNGPRLLATLALTTADPGRRRDCLAEGEALLQAGVVYHNHFWFYRDAVDVALEDRNWDGAERYAARLAACTAAEPLPWTDFFVARGRALAAAGRGARDAPTAQALADVRDEARRAGFVLAGEAVEQALAEL